MAQSRRSTRPTRQTVVRGDLIESGLSAREQEKAAFFALANRLAATSDPTEQKRLKEELARMTFGEP
jgi:hypothetical protein